MTALTHTFDPARRGYHAVYRDGERNHCPGCGRTQWLVGRSMAECAFCATALPLEASFEQPAATIIQRGQAVDPWPMPSFEAPRVVRRDRH